jgi:hypothetical protein
LFGSPDDGFLLAHDFYQKSLLVIGGRILLLVDRGAGANLEGVVIDETQLKLGSGEGVRGIEIDAGCAYYKISCKTCGCGIGKCYKTVNRQLAGCIGKLAFDTQAVELSGFDSDCSKGQSTNFQSETTNGKNLKSKSSLLTKVDPMGENCTGNESFSLENQWEDIVELLDLTSEIGKIVPTLGIGLINTKSF